MIAQYCDVCGVELTGKRGLTRLTKALQEVFRIEVICEECASAVDKVDWPVVAEAAILQKKREAEEGAKR